MEGQPGLMSSRNTSAEYLSLLEFTCSESASSSLWQHQNNGTPDGNLQEEVTSSRPAGDPPVKSKLFKCFNLLTARNVSVVFSESWLILICMCFNLLQSLRRAR